MHTADVPTTIVKSPACAAPVIDNKETTGNGITRGVELRGAHTTTDHATSTSDDTTSDERSSTNGRRSPLTIVTTATHSGTNTDHTTTTSDDTPGERTTSGRRSPLTNVTTATHSGMTTDHETTNTTHATVSEPLATNDSKQITLKHSGFNAKGFKQSFMYIAELLRDSDTIGISETWLRPGELSIVKDTLLKSPALSNLNDEDLVVFAKSGMCDADACYTGRLYGGIAVACKPRDNLC